jgi:hypothetical protein
MTEEERQQAADAWNNWRPGQSGRKSWSPFSRPIPPVRDGEGRPMKNGQVDWDRWAEEIEQGKWPRRR